MRGEKSYTTLPTNTSKLIVRPRTKTDNTYTLPCLYKISNKKEITLSQDEFFLSSEKVIPTHRTGKLSNIAAHWSIGSTGTNRLKIPLYNDVIERSPLVLKLMSYYNGASIGGTHLRACPKPSATSATGTIVFVG